MAMHDTEKVIEEFLGGNPRAAEWRALRQALEERLLALRRQRQQEAEQGMEASRLKTLDTQIAALDRQVATLETEEAVAQFVEDSIKVTVAKAAPDDEAEND